MITVEARSWNILWDLEIIAFFYPKGGHVQRKCSPPTPHWQGAATQVEFLNPEASEVKTWLTFMWNPMRNTCSTQILAVLWYRWHMHKVYTCSNQSHPCDMYVKISTRCKSFLSVDHKYVTYIYRTKKCLANPYSPFFNVHSWEFRELIWCIYCSSVV